MRRRLKLLPVLVTAFVIAACGMIAMNQLDADILILQDVAKETLMRKIAVEAENSTLSQENSRKDQKSYIMEKARSMYGYLMPGEMRFVIENPEVLYDSPETVPEATIVEEGT